MTNKINFLQYIRAFAAIQVLITHVLQLLNIHPFGYFFSGQYGVDVFFILSGFIIYLTTKELTNWKSFAIKRIFRIYPLYLICLLLYALYNTIQYNTTPSTLIIFQNIIMSPFSDTLTTRSLIVGQAWSTCYELYFYFTMCSLLILKCKKKYIIPLLALLFILGFIAKKIGLIEYGFLNYFYSLTTSTHIFKFCIGILFAMFYDQFKVLKFNGKKFSAIFISIQLLFLFVLLLKYNFIIAIIASSLFFLFWLFATNALKEYENNKIHRFIVYLGDISFSIYLIHLLVISVLLQQLEIKNLPLLLISSLIFTIILSHLLYKYIEKPFIEKGKYLSNKITNK